MKKIATFAFAGIAALSLAACGSSDSASEEAQAENVEMPADEAVVDVPAEATPAADAAATEAAPAADAAAAPAAEATAAAEAATAEAEKKM